MNIQKYLSKFLRQRPLPLSDTDVLLTKNLREILGCPIKDVGIYREAFTLKSSAKTKNYERLEFLGDSVLGSVIACHLFNGYPNGNEGFLTQMRSKIVNRKNLNKVGAELKLTSFIQNADSSVSLSENISGNLFEALIGALYIDQGYECCQKVLLQKLLTPEKILNLEKKVISYKSLLLEWSQKKKVTITYTTDEEFQPNKTVVFRTIVRLGEENIANAAEPSKKKSEEKAAQRAFYYLNKKEKIIGN